MFAHPLKYYRLAVAGVVLAAIGRAAEPAVSVSPFLPPQSAGGANAPTPGASLEYRGTLDLGDGMQFRVVDITRKTGVWLKLNVRDSNLDCVVKQFDGSGDKPTITVEQGGRTYTLAQHDAKVVSGGNPGQMPPQNLPGMAQPMPAAITNTVAVNPTPAQEQARLDAVVAEVQRRRALREQAAQQPGQAAPAPQVAPQPAANPQQNPQNPPMVGSRRGQ